MKFRLKEIADYIGGVLIGNGDIIITGVSEIDNSQEDTITFLGNMKYKKYLRSSKAVAFFVNDKKHDELAKFLEVPQINRIYDRMNQKNYDVDLFSEDLDQARYKLKDSLDFYATLIS